MNTEQGVFIWLENNQSLSSDYWESDSFWDATEKLLKLKTSKECHKHYRQIKY